MTLTIGINGFGRIGRMTARALVESGRDDMKLVRINATGPIESNAHLMRYDSVHGRNHAPVTVNGNTMNFGAGDVEFTSTRNIDELNWDGVDIVLECTGAFNSKEKSIGHTKRGAKRVLISAPADGVDQTVVYGVNHDVLSENDIVVSNASCTTNCLAPIAKTISDNFGIKKGFMTTIHSYTGDQPTLDKMHKDLYRARAAALSMIPTSTGAARAVGLVLPELKGVLDGSAIRVPTANVSVVDLKCIVKRPITIDEVHKAMKAASDGALNGVLGYTDEPLVSVDFVHDEHSSTYAARETNIMDGNLLRVMAWYDNEWGFSHRMLDTASIMGQYL